MVVALVIENKKMIVIEIFIVTIIIVVVVLNLLMILIFLFSEKPKLCSSDSSKVFESFECFFSRVSSFFFSRVSRPYEANSKLIGF